MNKKNIKYLIYILLLLIISILINLPDYIPEWKWILISVTCFIYLFAIVLSVKLVKNLKVKTKKNIPLSKIITSIVFLLIFGFSTFLNIFLINGGPFPPKYLQKYKTKNYNSTFYFYDASWLDPVLLVKIQKGNLPILKKFGVFPNASPQELKIKEKNDTLIISTYRKQFIIDLKKFNNKN